MDTLVLLALLFASIGIIMFAISYSIGHEEPIRDIVTPTRMDRKHRHYSK